MKNMADMDVSMWLGKPSTRPQAKNVVVYVPKPDEEEEIMGLKSDSNSPPSASVPSKEVSASPRESSSTHDSSSARSPSSESRLGHAFYIDIPNLLNKQDYEHLPDYFHVHKILREGVSGRYLVRLKSGELDLVSLLSNNTATLHYLPFILPSLTDMLLTAFTTVHHLCLTSDF